MRYLLFAFVVLASNVGTAQTVPTIHVTRFVQPSLHKVALSAGCKLTESLNSETFERNDYVECPGFAKTERFYTHHRGIGVLISDNHYFALVNDYYATKSSRVVLIDLASQRKRNMSAALIRSYIREVTPDKRIIVQPEAYGFSGNGKFVVVKVGPTYYCVSTRADTKRLVRMSQTRWYLLSTADGRVVDQSHGLQPPTSWDDRWLPNADRNRTKPQDPR